MSAGLFTSIRVLVIDAPDGALRPLVDRLTEWNYSVTAFRGGNGSACLEAGTEILIVSARLAESERALHVRSQLQIIAPRFMPIIVVDPQLSEGDSGSHTVIDNDLYSILPARGPHLDAWLERSCTFNMTQRVMHLRNQELEHLRTEQEEEGNLAVTLISKLVNVEKLKDPNVRYWLAPAKVFSGDVIAAARTPNDNLHLLLADGTGHGLVAAFTTLPVVAPFYGMTEKGYEIDSIAAEINRKLKQLLDVGYFVATTLVSINFHEGMVRVWNGGNPDALLMSERGGVIHRFASRHLPLGILDEEDFDNSVETVALPISSQLAMYSDGLIEAEWNGKAFGATGLERALNKAEPRYRMESLVHALDKHMRDELPHDDISLMIVNCERDLGEHRMGAARVDAMTQKPMRPGHWEFAIKLDHSQLKQLDVVPILSSIANQLEPDPNRSSALFVVLSELFNNALDHGLLRLDSRIKQSEDGIEVYLAERQTRLAELTEGDIDICIAKVEEDGCWYLKVSCRDSGDGFDVATVMNRPIDDDQPFGRGLALLRGICSQVHFNQEGNHATVYL